MNNQIKYIKLNKQSGIAFIMTLLIMTGLLALALGITSLLVRELKLSQEIANSVVAYSVADAGIEKFMYGINKDSLDLTSCVCPVICYPSPTPSPLSNGASYSVCVFQAIPPIKVNSTGSYGGTNRTVQITF